jgi:Pyridoxamine 5'-phosphate oxidase
VICATNGRDGWPHLMPLWYVVRDGELWAWTYAKSQKVRNLERDARCTLQVEAGGEYTQLRGVMLACEAVIHRDLATVAGVGGDIAGRYGLPVEAMRAQAPKRVGLQFAERRRATWDHRKLGGTY